MLTVKLLCLESLKALIGLTFPLATVRKKAPTVIKIAKAVSTKAPIVSKKAKIVNCKQESSTVSRKLPTVSKEAASKNNHLELLGLLLRNALGEAFYLQFKVFAHN